MTTIVWTKNQCIYCEWAKNLLRKNEIEFEERNINAGYNKQDMINYLEKYHDIDSQEKITMPQIIVANHHIGGFTELKAHLKS